MTTENCGSYYNVLNEGVSVGTLSLMMDKKYKFIPEKHVCLSAEELRYIADRIHFLNQ